MSNVIKIALIGKMRSGKNALADYATFMYDFKQFAFGDELKRLAHEAFPWIPREPKPRSLYQSFGQAVREIDSDVWVKRCIAKINEYIADNRCPTCGNCRQLSVIVTDCRQPNEYERLKAEGFVFIRINASDDVRRERAIAVGDVFTDEDMAHDTESHVDSFTVDYEITNDGELWEFHKAFDKVLAEIKRGKR